MNYPQLKAFFTPKALDYCQIDDYRIDKVSYDERLPSFSGEPDGDFMRGVHFSIKPIEVPKL